MQTNKQALEEALEFFPGGVNSPARAFKAVGGGPVFMARSFGSRIRDIEGRDYVDYVGSWGPMILGHSDPKVVEAAVNAVRTGMSFGAPTLGETELAGLVRDAFPMMEKMRFVSSGTEATMSAIRVARGFTGRDLIVKCDGAYHGHADSLLVSAGSGLATLGIPDCPGVPAAVAAATIVIPFNDVNALEETFQKHGCNIAAVIVEPVCGNMGVVKPVAGYLEALRRVTSTYDTCLIFDEVMTGFRACFGGVSTLEGIRPDLCCLGKVVGGGMPLGAYGGRKDIMAQVAPDGPVYQAGTLSGNPVATAAGAAVLRHIKEGSNLFHRLNDVTTLLADGLTSIAEKHSIEHCLNRFGSMFTLFFTTGPVIDFVTAKKSDTTLFSRWFKGMLERGVYLPPSQFEACFVSASHSGEDVKATLAAADEVMAGLNQRYR